MDHPGPRHTATMRTEYQWWGVDRERKGTREMARCHRTLRRVATGLQPHDATALACYCTTQPNEGRVLGGRTVPAHPMKELPLTMSPACLRTKQPNCKARYHRTMSPAGFKTTLDRCNRSAAGTMPRHLATNVNRPATARCNRPFCHRIRARLREDPAPRDTFGSMNHRCHDVMAGPLTGEQCHRSVSGTTPPIFHRTRPLKFPPHVPL